MAQRFYFIFSGSVCVTADDDEHSAFAKPTENSVLKRGDFFGVCTLRYRVNRNKPPLISQCRPIPRIPIKPDGLERRNASKSLENEGTNKPLEYRIGFQLSIESNFVIAVVLH